MIQPVTILFCLAASFAAFPITAVAAEPEAANLRALTCVGLNQNLTVQSFDVVASQDAFGFDFGEGHTVSGKSLRVERLIRNPSDSIVLYLTIGEERFRTEIFGLEQSRASIRMHGVGNSINGVEAECTSVEPSNSTRELLSVENIADPVVTQRGWLNLSQTLDFACKFLSETGSQREAKLEFRPGPSGAIQDFVSFTEGQNVIEGEVANIAVSDSDGQTSAAAMFALGDEANRIFSRIRFYGPMAWINLSTSNVEMSDFTSSAGACRMIERPSVEPSQ